MKPNRCWPKSLRDLLKASCVGCAFLVSYAPTIQIAQAQIVQLPTVGSFSLQSSAYVPDSGTAHLAGVNAGRTGSTSRGPLGRTAIGSEQSAGNVSVRTTIIDLNELDEMIRSQTGNKSTVPNLTAAPSTKRPNYTMRNPGTAFRKPEYSYLEAISHSESSQPDRMNDDARYYLKLAAGARQLAHWNAVELYYKMAWESLPEERRQVALTAMLDARKKAEESNASEKRKASQRSN